MHIPASRMDMLNWLQRPFAWAMWLCFCSMTLAFDLLRREILSAAELLPLLLAAMALICVLLFWGILRLERVARGN